MPFASVGVCTVLWSNVLFASAVFSDHIASPSSPVLRMNEFETLEFVTPVWKFTPSAMTSVITVFVMWVLSMGPSNQMPTFV